MKPVNRKQKLIAEINITPFTDVILVLLIIFMITTPLILQSNIKVNLPEAKSGTKPDRNNRQVNITINNENLVYLDNELLTRKELKERMSVIYKDNPDLSVVLLSDRLVHFREIVNILDILNELGIRNLNIAAKTEYYEKNR